MMNLDEYYSGSFFNSGRNFLKRSSRFVCENLLQKHLRLMGITFIRQKVQKLGADFHLNLRFPIKLNKARPTNNKFAIFLVFAISVCNRL